MTKNKSIEQLTLSLLGISVSDGLGSMINGEIVTGQGNESIQLVDPATEEKYAEYTDAGSTVVDDCVSSAIAGQQIWQSKTPSDRGVIMWAIGQRIRDAQTELAELESQTAGKPIRDARAEVEGVAKMFEYYAGWCDKIYGDVIPVPSSHLNYTRRQPLGVVLQITPWNAPLATCGWQVAPAICAGNAALLKPSELTPISSLVAAKLAIDAGLPKGVFNVLVGLGHTTGNSVIEHSGTNKVVFIGSPENGSRIAAAAAKKVKPCLLELGGKSANIVFPDADLDRAIAGAQQAIFAAAGQSCVAGSRLLVHKDIEAEFLDRLAHYASRIPIGMPLDEQVHVGPVQNKRQFERIGSLVSDASDQGLSIITGGSRASGFETGYFFSPTVISDAKPTDKIAQTEVFGPVLTALTFRDEEEAVAIANQTRFGLAGAVWTNDVARAHRVATQVNAGTFWINSYKTISVMSPFGGFGESGYGRSSGREVLDEYSQIKSVWVETAENPAQTFGYFENSNNNGE